MGNTIQTILHFAGLLQPEDRQLKAQVAEPRAHHAPDSRTRSLSASNVISAIELSGVAVWLKEKALPWFLHRQGEEWVAPDTRVASENGGNPGIIGAASGDRTMIGH
jgi:hypothetical protein